MSNDRWKTDLSQIEINKDAGCSATFIAYAPGYAKKPFPCVKKQEEGEDKYYNLEFVDRDGDWDEVLESQITHYQLIDDAPEG